MTELPLDTRQARIARALLDLPALASVDHLASALQLTPRVVRYNLPPVERYLAGYSLRLVRRRGAGIWLDGNDHARATARTALEGMHGPAVLDPEDRQARVLLTLLDAAPEAVKSELLETRLGVSGPTVRRDVRAAEQWLEQHRLHLRRLPGVGLAVRGSEVEVRAALVAIVLEVVPATVLSACALGSAIVPPATERAGVLAFVASLDLPVYLSILSDQLSDIDPTDPTIITATLAIGIQAGRIRAGHPARLVRGRLRSLLDHPVSEPARRIAVDVGRHLGISLGSAETAAMTESLLGFAELVDPQAVPAADVSALVDRLVAGAAGRLHPSLAEDQLLRENLTEHLRRLHVRLRYGLPISNPLLAEVRRRYPDVHRVAEVIGADLGALEGVRIPAEEIGFLTMYLAGSLERLRLRPKIQVTVVCPAGMATAWILVSRLLAEFPQLEVAKVVSKTVFEHESDAGGSDLVISTVPLEGKAPARSLVVSPLLEERDVRRIARLLGVVAAH